MCLLPGSRFPSLTLSTTSSPSLLSSQRQLGPARVHNHQTSRTVRVLSPVIFSSPQSAQHLPPDTFSTATNLLFYPGEYVISLTFTCGLSGVRRTGHSPTFGTPCGWGRERPTTPPVWSFEVFWSNSNSLFLSSSRLTPDATAPSDHYTHGFLTTRVFSCRFLVCLFSPYPCCPNRRVPCRAAATQLSLNLVR